MPGIPPMASLRRADPGREASGRVPVYDTRSWEGVEKGSLGRQSLGSGKLWPGHLDLRGRTNFPKVAVPAMELDNQVQEVEASHSLSSSSLPGPPPGNQGLHWGPQRC